MTPEQLRDKLDESFEKALTLCTSAKEYTDLLKVAVEYYDKRAGKDLSTKWGEGLKVGTNGA